MKMSSKLSFKSFAAFGTAALIVSSAFAASWSTCDPICKNYAQGAYESAKASYAAQQTSYCNSLPNPNATASCLASVPSYSEYQAQSVYTSVYNSCMQSCTHS